MTDSLPRKYDGIHLFESTGSLVCYWCRLGSGDAPVNCPGFTVASWAIGAVRRGILHKEHVRAGMESRFGQGQSPDLLCRYWLRSSAEVDTVERVVQRVLDTVNAGEDTVTAALTAERLTETA